MDGKLVLLFSFALILEAQSQIQNITPQEISRIMQLNNECQRESKVPERLLTNAIVGQISNDPRLAAHLVCMSKRLGFLDDAGQLNRSAIEKEMSRFVRDPQQVQKLMQSCIKDQATPEQTAIRVSRCLFDSFISM